MGFYMADSTLQLRFQEAVKKNFLAALPPSHCCAPTPFPNNQCVK